MKKKLTLLLLPIMILGLSACGGEPEPEAPQEPEIEVTSAQLLADYDANEVSADSTYKGKLARISGPVGDIGKALGSTYITLTDGQPYSILSVQCSFDDEAEIEKLGSLSQGQEVTVIGTISGQSLNVTVDDCKLA